MIRVLGIVVCAALVACGDDKTSATDECGDGVITGAEVCDDGADNGAGGCTASCTFACVEPTADCGAPPACQVAMCTTDHVCVFGADPSQDGQACGTGMVCGNGTCVSAGMCGNGVVEGSEQCDFGTANGPDSGCEDTCTFSCGSASDCDDANMCNGAEVCADITVNGIAGKQCASGTPENDGTVCGTDLICINELCSTGTCGDSFTTAPEECDDANASDGDGCNNDCSYSCVSSDATRNCTPADACQGQGTCDDSTHTCTPGTPLDDDTPCGTGGYCKTGTCTQPVCPNGDQEPGETCDDGDMTNGDGCDNDCTYSCVNAATDCGSAPACQMWQCSGSHVCEAVADASKNGDTCGTNGETCNNGACTGGVCGNGVTEAGEECDFGSANNGADTGCETNCTFSCDTALDCDDGNTCDGAEVCSNVTVMGHAGKQCAEGTAPAENTSCGTGKICKSEACVDSVCGDSYTDAARGETCDPPGTQTCDAACNALGCGNGIRSLDEQCDDSNTTNLDGCSSTCTFEQCQRVTDLDLRFDTSTYCMKNALGGAVKHQEAKDMVLQAIDSGVADGSITVIFQFLGLDDLTGTNDANVTVGVVGGTPVQGTGYDGTADLDWWYTVDPLDLSGARTPVSTIPGSIAAKELNTTSSSMAFTVNFAGVDVTMDMFNTTIRAPIGPATTPTASTGTTPGHLASEHLDPALTSFSRMGRPDDPATTNVNEYQPVELCGATTARSLADTNVATAVVDICPDYTINHSLLDLYIGGCRVFFIVTVIQATQPDTSKTAGVTYEFRTDSNRYVTSCIKKVNGQTVSPAPSLDECLDNAGYTSYYRMLFNRVIGK